MTISKASDQNYPKSATDLASEGSRYDKLLRTGEATTSNNYTQAIARYRQAYQLNTSLSSKLAELHTGYGTHLCTTQLIVPGLLQLLQGEVYSPFCAEKSLEQISAAVMTKNSHRQKREITNTADLAIDLQSYLSIRTQRLADQVFLEYVQTPIEQEIEEMREEIAHLGAPSEDLSTDFLENILLRISRAPGNCAAYLHIIARFFSKMPKHFRVSVTQYQQLSHLAHESISSAEDNTALLSILRAVQATFDAISETDSTDCSSHTPLQKLLEQLSARDELEISLSAQLTLEALARDSKPRFKRLLRKVLLLSEGGIEGAELFDALQQNHPWYETARCCQLLVEMNAWSSLQRIVTHWSSQHPSLARKTSVKLLRSDNVIALSFSSDNQLLSAAVDGSVEGWKQQIKDIQLVAFARDGKELVNVRTDNSIWLNHSKLADSSEKICTLACYSELLATGHVYGSICLWQRNGAVEHLERLHRGRISSLSFARREQLLASSSWDGDIRLWSGSRHYQLLAGHQGRVEVVVFSRDDQLLASGGEDCSVRIWHRQKWHQPKVLRKHTERIVALSFSLHDQLLASADRDSTIYLWQVEKGEVLQTLESNELSVRHLAFSPDSEWLACGHQRGVDGWHVLGEKFDRAKLDQRVIAAVSFFLAPHRQRSEVQEMLVDLFASSTSSDNRLAKVPLLYLEADRVEQSGKRLVLEKRELAKTLTPITKEMELTSILLNRAKRAIAERETKPLEIEGQEETSQKSCFRSRACLVSGGMALLAVIVTAVALGVTLSDGSGDGSSPSSMDDPSGGCLPSEFC